MKALILYRDPRWIGGVVSFNEMLQSHFSMQWEAEQYKIGARFNSSASIVKIMFPLSDALGLFRTLGRATPDAIHINPSLNLASVLRDGLFMMVFRFRNRRNVLVFWHGWEEKLAKRISSNRLMRILFRWLYGFAGHTVVLANSFRYELLGIGFPPEKVSVATTMFDGSIFNGIERHGSEEIKVIFLSRMEQSKGVMELIEGFAKIKLGFPETKLIMVGDGPAKSSLVARVKELGMSDDVSFPGYLKGAEKAQALVDADIFVLPSYEEGCPVSLLEAMAAGLPCITNAVGGIPDIFQDGVNGVLLNGVSKDTVASALERLLGDPDLRVQIGEHNKREAWNRYEATVVTQRIEEFYGMVASLDASH